MRQKTHAIEFVGSWVHNGKSLPGVVCLGFKTERDREREREEGRERERVKETKRVREKGGKKERSKEGERE